MIIYPAIDIFEGKVVRLIRGDYEQMTVYSNDPVAVAAGYRDAGAGALHIVDLEGARAGGPMNFDIIKNIAAVTGLFTQAGGGIRTRRHVEMYLNAGISRVILGTAAVAQPDFLSSIASEYPGRIAVSADIKDGFVAVKGWMELSDYDLLTFCRTVEAAGVKTIICTDISKDGMQSGANIDLYQTLRRELSVDIISSGGVSSLEDIKALSRLGISGAIIGKALYEGGIDLKEALLS